MRYDLAPDLYEIAVDISKTLFPYIKIDRIKCYRSVGTNSRGTIARCHALGKLMQEALDVDAFYALEFLSERFEKLSKEDQVKVIIHELMHIPYTFGGGFKHHDVVTSRNVEKNYKLYLNLRNSRLNANQSVLEPNVDSANVNIITIKPEIKKSGWFGGF